MRDSPAEMKPDIEEEETEEEIETPIDLVESPMRREARPKKRSRPVSEIEEDQESVRVKLWRMLKDSLLKDEDIEPYTLTDLSDAPLRMIEKVEDLSDNEDCMRQHQQVRHAMFRLLHRRQKRQKRHQKQLRRAYRQKFLLWQAHMDKLDAQRQLEMQRLGISKPEPPPEKDTMPPTPGTEIGVPEASARGTRRAQQAAHARDYVQSEAEFQELMASLGTEEKDPTATIPPMLPPDERDDIEFDDNALIDDPVTFYTRALFTVEEGTKVDCVGWTEEEDKTYIRRLSIAGKQFGRFRRAPQLADRSVQELVQHYYFLKGHGAGFDWRNVIAGKNRYGRALGRGGAASVLMGSGAPNVKPRPGRGRGRTKSAAIPLLHKDDEEDTRSAIDEDADDSASMTERARRGRKKIIDTAAKQRPKRSSAPTLLKEKVRFSVKFLTKFVPSPALSNDEPPPSRERSILPNPLPPYGEFDVSTDRDSSVGDGKKRLKPQQTSSYWRVTEMEMFPKHLLTYGKNWSKIAEEMGTKTAQQVQAIPNILM
jgi:hypothetical protein